MGASDAQRRAVALPPDTTREAPLFTVADLNNLGTPERLAVGAFVRLPGGSVGRLVEKSLPADWWLVKVGTAILRAKKGHFTVI
jgi:hypothetical protein